MASAEQRARREEASTDPMIPLAGVRETVARECLHEAEAALARDPAGARLELERLASDFPDTEAGRAAQAHLERLG